MLVWMVIGTHRGMGGVGDGRVRCVIPNTEIINVYFPTYVKAEKKNSLQVGNPLPTCRPLQMVAIYLQSQYGTAILSSPPLKSSVFILT